jgi:hypothetical protein
MKGKEEKKWKRKRSYDMGERTNKTSKEDDAQYGGLQI